jgi:MSHA biogenesis protein MshP
MGGRRQRGFALVAAVFIVVVLALLGIMMVTIGGMQRATTSAAVQGARAYHAARSGIEWGAYQATEAASCVASTAFPSVTGHEGFAITVECASTAHRERGDDLNIYVITSIATSGSFGNTDYVSRRIQVTVTNVAP